MAATATPLQHPDATISIESDDTVVLGLIERRFGLLTHLQYVMVEGIIDRAADLAVADRVAFAMSATDHRQYAVFLLDGWYCIGALKTPLTDQQLATLKGSERRGCAILLSVVSERGIRPLLPASS